MVRDVSLKVNTLRIAKARACLKVDPATITAIHSGKLPKADPLGVAKVAAIQAAKNTSLLIPYCHQVPLDSVEVDFLIQNSGIEIRSIVKAIWKTGVEMEALVAASVAALTLYDMLKPIDKTMEISSTQLVQKEGGKTSFLDRPPKDFRAAVIVTSDGTAAGTREDKSGKIILERLKEFGVADPDYVILPDERDLITQEIRRFCDADYNLVLTTGGTGLGPRDQTVEATCELIQRSLPGVAETMRSFGQQRTPYAMLSRGIVGMRGKTIIANLPGSSAGAEESMATLFPALFHAYPIAEGGGH